MSHRKPIVLPEAELPKEMYAVRIIEKEGTVWRSEVANMDVWFDADEAEHEARDWRSPERDAEVVRLK